MAATLFKWLCALKDAFHMDVFAHLAKLVCTVWCIYWPFHLNTFIFEEMFFLFLYENVFPKQGRGTCFNDYVIKEEGSRLMIMHDCIGWGRVKYRFKSNWETLGLLNKESAKLRELRSNVGSVRQIVTRVTWVIFLM